MADDMWSLEHLETGTVALCQGKRMGWLVGIRYAISRLSLAGWMERIDRLRGRQTTTVQRRFTVGARS